MNERWVSVFVSLALVVALAGCSGNKKSSAPATTNSPGSESNTLPPNPSGWTAGADLSKFDLLAIDFVDDQKGWAVGDISPEGGPLLYTTDGGNRWQVIARITEVFSSIQFLTPSTGWMAGYAGRIERTDDGGRTWKTQRFEREGDVLNALYFIDNEHGWAVGGRGLVLRTTDGGTRWEPTPTNRVEDLWAVRFATAERGWAVGEDGLILATTDGGATWAQQKSVIKKALFGLALLPSGALVAVGESGTVLLSESGKDWREVSSGTSEMLNAVDAADNQTLWAVGSSGVTVKSTNGGNTWSVAAPVSARHLLAIALLNAKRGIAVGRRGAIQKLQE